MARTTLPITGALGLTGLVAVGTFAASFAVEPTDRHATDSVQSMTPLLQSIEDAFDDPAWLDRNIDWVLRGTAAALIVPMALLAVALQRSRPTTTAEVH